MLLISCLVWGRPVSSHYKAINAVNNVNIVDNNETLRHKWDRQMVTRDLLFHHLLTLHYHHQPPLTPQIALWFYSVWLSEYKSYSQIEISSYRSPVHTRPTACKMRKMWLLIVIYYYYDYNGNVLLLMNNKYIHSIRLSIYDYIRMLEIEISVFLSRQEGQWMREVRENDKYFLRPSLRCCHPSWTGNTEGQSW